MGGSPPTLNQAQASLEEGSWPTKLQEFLPSSMSTAPLLPGILALWMLFKRLDFIHCKQKGIQAPGPWTGASASQAQSLGCLLRPDSILPPEPGDRLPAHTQVSLERKTVDCRRRACSVGT